MGDGMNRTLNADFWAQRAAEAEETAQGMRNPMAKRTMERLSSIYGAFARNAAERDTQVIPEAVERSVRAVPKATFAVDGADVTLHRGRTPSRAPGSAPERKRAPLPV